MNFQALFTESKGQPITYKGKVLQMIDKIELPSNEVCVKIAIISPNSKWKQGIILKTKGKFEIDEQTLSDKIVLWEDTAPKQIQLIVKSKDKSLIVYNVWELEDKTVHYWYYGGAMYVVESEEGRIYNCNDGYPDDDFDDLIFKISMK